MQQTTQVEEDRARPAPTSFIQVTPTQLCIVNSLLPSIQASANQNRILQEPWRKHRRSSRAFAIYEAVPTIPPPPRVPSQAVTQCTVYRDPVSSQTISAPVISLDSDLDDDMKPIAAPPIRRKSSTGDIEILGACSPKPSASRAQLAEEDEFVEGVHRAEEQCVRDQTLLRSTLNSPAKELTKMYVSSDIAGTKPVLTWFAIQQKKNVKIPPDSPDDVILTRRKRVYTYSTLLSLDIRPQGDGRLVADTFGSTGFTESLCRVHLEAHPFENSLLPQNGEPNDMQPSSAEDMLPPAHPHQDIPRPSSLIPPSDSSYVSVLNSGESTHILDVGCGARNLSRAALGALVEEQENEAKTDNMIISDVRLESYMIALVDDLSQKIGNLFQGPEVVEELAAALTRVLKAFSCKICYAHSSQMHRDVMVFIHQYRGWFALRDGLEYEVLPEQSWETSPGNEFEEDHELSVPGLEEYKNIISTAPSYDGSSANWVGRERVLGAIPGNSHVSRKAASQTVQVTYAVDCDLLAFLRGQEYDVPADEAIAGVVTLTGSKADAQASRCQQYLDQTWPCTGSQTLMFVQKMLRNPDYDAQVFVSEPSACKLAASLDDGCLDGSRFALVSYANKVVTECTPFVDDIGPVEDALHCRIKFDFQPCQEQFGAINGQCWHDMFHSAVIVRGFPILRRPETNTGLEMPSDLMTLLTRTRYVDEFGLGMFIKGFSTMLIPIKRSDGMIYWHLLFNKNPEERISYLDCRLEHAAVQKADLETSRHVLGWCSDAVGTVDKVDIHAGQLVTGAACFSLGNREKPVHISRDGYFTKLQWISSKWVVFWDEGEKRGWLINGASALLHILRASLTHSKRKFKSAFLMNPQDLLDLEDTTGADAALQLLANEKNRSLPLYRENVEFENHNTDLGKAKEPATRFRWTLRSAAGCEYSTNRDAILRDGISKTSPPDGDPFFARVATLNALGKGWVDFIRSIYAVALLGRGFGELVQPKGPSNGGCPRWLTLPAERYYLAACISELRKIMEDHGDAQLNPMKLCDNSPKHYEPVQALFPMTFRHLLKTKPLAELQEVGGVFGHNINIHWHWKDFGDPIKGDPPEEGSSSDSFEDSSLGSSLGSCGSPSSSATAQALSSASHTASTRASDPSGFWTHDDQQC
ncbi:hypothetical protein B0T10DRAFT_466249 [Thelonectria olida]|uniref:Uncharacterized protein n=1 Tax=Thelonectria olida TaxID=1576542 RepID=A0A9P8VUA1_9HYPO|nr:hypothetical protein B0T10DRAFT_466249 [Thelonectria olida]